MHKNFKPVDILTSTLALHSITIATQSIQRSTYDSRKIELQQCGLDASHLYGFVSQPPNAICQFFGDVVEQKKSIDELFADTYNIHPHEVLDIECDLNDNAQFWESFYQSINAEASPESMVLAYAVLITLAEMNRYDHPIVRAEDARFLDMLMHFYQIESEAYRAKTIGCDATEERLWEDKSQIDAVAYHCGSGRKLDEYISYHIPEILLAVRDDMMRRRACPDVKLVTIFTDENTHKHGPAVIGGGEVIKFPKRTFAPSP